MPSNFTEHYQLNQWSPGDQVLREDFNADNAKLDAALAELQTTLAARGNCCLWFGSYTGTGTYGKSAPITLTFTRKPLVVLIFNEPCLVAVRGRDENVLLNSTYKSCAEWGDMSVNLFAYQDARVHMNTDGRVYYYCAFLEV